MGRFKGYTLNDLRDNMRRNYRLAASFSGRSEGYTGDTWWMEANDMQHELEARGCTVIRDHYVLKPNEWGCEMFGGTINSELPED